jgi:hypothetical protein
MPDKNIIPTDAREALKQISQFLERLQADPAIQKIARTLSALRDDPRFAHFRNWHEQRQRLMGLAVRAWRRAVCATALQRGCRAGFGRGRACVRRCRVVAW